MKSSIKLGNLNNIEDFLSRLRHRALDGDNSFPTEKDLIYFKKELNNATGDTIECQSVYYTRNTDKMFFGMCCYPIISPEIVSKIFFDPDNTMTIKDKKSIYLLEIDSRIWDFGLNVKEVTAILLHEIGHIVLDDAHIYRLREIIDQYITFNNISMREIGSAMSSYVILKYALEDTLIKTYSIFHTYDKEFRADTFCISAGYGASLESATKKISRYMKSIMINSNVPKYIILDWAIRTYLNLDIKRINAIHLLNKAKLRTGSKVIILSINTLIDALSEGAKYNRNIYGEKTNILIENRGFIGKITYSGLRSLEDDFYEFSIRVKNAETEEDVMYALRGINSRMSMLNQFINDNAELMEESEYDKWSGLYNNYNELRSELSKKKSYNFKNYGLFFDYNKFN